MPESGAHKQLGIGERWDSKYRDTPNIGTLMRLTLALRMASVKMATQYVVDILATILCIAPAMQQMSRFVEMDCT